MKLCRIFLSTVQTFLPRDLAPVLSG